MVEGDDDKEADASTPPMKRPLDRVPLKLIIRRNRPNENHRVESKERPRKRHKERKEVPHAVSKERKEVPHAVSKDIKEVPHAVSKELKEIPHAVSKEIPPTPPSTLTSKPKINSILPFLVNSKYAAEIPELVTAFETEKPKGLQEVWHSVQQRKQEDLEEGVDKEKVDWKDIVSRYYATSFCDFGSECEMPWLHPALYNVSNWENHEGLEQVAKPQDEPLVVDESLSTGNTDETNKLCDLDNKDQDSDDSINFSDWRYGPAKLWYDQMNISEEDKNFDFGFKLKQEQSECHEELEKQKGKMYSDDAYLMVSQLSWEDDVIWNGDNIKAMDLNSMKLKWKKVGGKSPSFERALTHPGFRYHHRLPGYLQVQNRDFFHNKPTLFRTPYSMHGPINREKDEEHSILPFDNEDLTLGIWEKEIIWDAENMTQIPRPKLPLLDPNDDNIILGVPDDVNLHEPTWSGQNHDCVKLSHPYIKGSKILIGKNGITNINEKEQQHFAFEDPFNASNDSYYALKSSETSLRLKPIGKIIQHSIPVLELRSPFIPTYLNVFRLQNFHRVPLKKYHSGILAHSRPHPVYSLSREISLKAKFREEECEASGGGDVFFMRGPEDLSGRDGDLVLVEFSEEHPLLMNEVGMCSKIINYYKRKASKDQGPPPLKYGEVVYPHTSPFLGMLSQGECIQAVENNLYRCPIYEHQIRETDFLIVRTRNSYAIREFNALFVAGQQCPLYEVPAPRSKPATNFIRDFLQVYIFRMFSNCPDRPRWAKMDEIKRAFPDTNDINIRKCLRLCSDFKRVDALDASCWVLRSDFRLPTEEELREIITPEQCCAQFSMLAAEQRLKDAGYGGNVLFVPPDEDDEDNEDGMQLKIDDEVKAAPWNLTRGFIQSLNGKCLLELSGLADPTGCGEGFSYLTKTRREGKQLVMQETEVDKEKPTVTNAKILLKKMGVPEKEIKKLSCWELVDIARQVSKKKRGRKSGKVPKARPMTTAEHVAKYKEECQRVFDLQNRVLQLNDELSSDEGELSEDDGSDVEEMGKILEKLISDGRTYSDLCNESEEKEREELVKMMMDENAHKQSSSEVKIKKNERKDSHIGSQPGRVLKINRTFRDSNGKEYTRVEFVRKSSVIDIYLKIRATKDEAFISQFSALESAERQKILREKRLIEGQLQRLKQRENILGSKSDSHVTAADTSANINLQAQNHSKAEEKRPSPFICPPSRKALNTRLDPKRRCGACGNPGHKKGNRACPNYSGPVNVAMTEEEEEEYHRQMNVDDQNLVNVDGTKLKLSVKLIKRAEEMKRKTLVLRVPKDIVRKRRRNVVEAECDYLQNKYQKTVNRRRVDPLVVLSNAFEGILNEMRDLPESDPFHFPVNAKVLPHYYTIITHPVDLQTIRDNLRQRKYQSRKDFLEDVHQIVQNSSIFNGPESSFTINAGKMLDLCVRRMGEQEDELIRLEETINPSDDEKDQPIVPQKTVTISASDHGSELGETQSTQSEEAVPKSIVDLAMSDTEDELETGYLDGRACPAVP